MAKPKLTRKTADKYDLYQRAVQCPEADVPFLVREYKKRYRRLPVVLLEDFCGTALLCCEWVKSRSDRRAIGIDLDPEPLAWGREHNLPPLGDKADRVALIEGNVLDVKTEKPDIRVAFNFSYFLFLTRKDLLAYFKRVRKSMGSESLFCLDLHGGPEAQQEEHEPKKKGGFTYIWDQGAINPIDHLTDCHISFKFKDGSKWKKAFSYHWRLWGLMELRDVLADAGFSETKVFWEGTDHETNEGNGIYREATKAENDDSWIVYVIAYP